MEPTAEEPPDSTRWSAGCCSHVLQNRRTTNQAGRTRPCLEERDIQLLLVENESVHRGFIGGG